MLFFALQVFQLPLNINDLLGDIQPDSGHGHDVINALLQNPALRKTRVKDTGQRLLSLLVNSETLNSMTGGKVSTVRRSSMLVWEVE